MMNSKRSRLNRKAARVQKTQFERQLDDELGEAKRARDAACSDASAAYKATVEEARTVRAKATAEAWDEYQAARDAIVTRLAADEAVAA